jgi:hypothetical protein
MWEQLAQVREAATGLAQAPAWPLSDDELAARLAGVHAAEQALAAAKLHLVAEIDGRGLPRRPTSVDNGCLLCGHHHRVVHHDGWEIQLGHDKHPEFIPPSHVDSERGPRRNIYHRTP